MTWCWQLIVATVAVIIVFKLRSSLIYNVKFILGYSYVLGTAALLVPFLILRPKKVENLVLCSEVMRFSATICGITCTIRGREHFSKDETCVFVANHQTGLDLIGMFEIWHLIKRMTVIAKRELMYVGSFGLACWLAGITFIDRQAGGKAGEAMNDALISLKKKKIKLWVFPEGTRRNTGEIHQFKKGAFHAAIRAQVPIVPVVYSSYKHFLDADKKIFDKGEIIITALPPISTVGLKATDVDSLVQKTRDLMIETYNAASKETANATKS